MTNRIEVNLVGGHEILDGKNVTIAVQLGRIYPVKMDDAIYLYDVGANNDGSLTGIFIGTIEYSSVCSLEDNGFSDFTGEVQNIFPPCLSEKNPKNSLT